MSNLTNSMQGHYGENHKTSEHNNKEDKKNTQIYYFLG